MLRVFFLLLVTDLLVHRYKSRGLLAKLCSVVGVADSVLLGDQRSCNYRQSWLWILTAEGYSWASPAVDYLGPGQSSSVTNTKETMVGLLL